MSIKKLLTLALIASFMSCAALANAQINIPSPKFRSKPVDSIDNTQPWAELGQFNYDAQMFAPVEFTNHEELDPNIGFYFVYDRSYTSVSKASARVNDPTSPFSTGVARGTNYQWGNRFELGYMTEDGAGWGITYDRSMGGYFTNGRDFLVVNPMLVETDLASVEINRQFRQQLSQGGYIEPYIGMRYISVSDNTIEDSAIGGPTGTNRFKQNATNNIIAAQVGARYAKRTGRFRTTLDGAVATGYNRQGYFATDLQTQAAGPIVFESHDSGTSFVPVVDFRAELAYNISRDLGLRTGFQVMYMWDGVARADTLSTAFNSNSVFGLGSGVAGVFDESTTAAGFTFGIEWKR